MIEINRHIEILLLSNDCVIVPGFGGFMAHHVDARYDGTDNMFLPPLRTVGFNPQLTMNDSLLVLSYVETYDMSYPEALRRIEDEVAEIRQTLENEGNMRWTTWEFSRSMRMEISSLSHTRQESSPLISMDWADLT